MYLSRYATFFSDDQLLCFKKVTVGLEHESLWFNHGFDSTSGPISNMNYQPYLLEEFKNFVLSKLNIRASKCPPNVVLVFESEFFANSDEIVKALKRKYPKLHFKPINPKKLSNLNDVIKEVGINVYYFLLVQNSNVIIFINNKKNNSNFCFINS